MTEPSSSLTSPAKRPNRVAHWALVRGTGIHTFLYKRGLGRKMGSSTPILVTVKGRKSGKPITVTLGTLRESNDYIVIGSMNGADYDPQWWLNMLANPEVTVQDGDRTLKGKVEWVADPTERAALWKKVVAAMPGYANYEKKTTRVIPLGRIRPVS
ncbi:MAG TPA: nitroreductase/quinone reductase family protein [Candidatus Dormibacteraeota bacterium]|nr:nitroreductase/quinone reductase family protein [Candidatus Dormibacteraeota bacterium]